MVAFVRPPTSDEMQYAGDVIHGRRRLDIIVFGVFSLLGAVLGFIVGIAGAQANDEPVNLGFALGCAAIFAVALLVTAMLIMSSIRSLQAVCRVWLPARVVVALAAIAFALRILDTVQYVLIVGPASIASKIALGSMGFVFALLFLNLGVRLIFIIYCMVTGRDEDEIVTRSISAKRELSPDTEEHDPNNSPITASDHNGR